MNNIQIGDKKYQLKIIKTRKGRKGSRILYCECNCGQTYKIYSNAFGRTKSCGCLKSRKGKNNPKWNGCGDISGEYWSKVVSNAKKRKIEFKVDVSYAWEIFEKQKGLCALTGRKIYFGVRTDKTKRYGTASLDRLENNKGYVKGNLQWVHKDINIMRQDFDITYFIDTCKEVIDWSHDGI